MPHRVDAGVAHIVLVSVISGSWFNEGNIKTSQAKNSIEDNIVSLAANIAQLESI